jgi:hypothetical protein
MSDDPQEVEVNGDPKKASRDVQQQSKALNSITDYVEEKEMDASKVKQVRFRWWSSRFLQFESFLSLPLC